MKISETKQDKEIIINEYNKLIKQNSLELTIILIHFNYKYSKKFIRKTLNE